MFVQASCIHCRREFTFIQARREFPDTTYSTPQCPREECAFYFRVYYSWPANFRAYYSWPANRPADKDIPEDFEEFLAEIARGGR